MKNIFQSIILSLLIIGTINLPKELNAKEITNIQWNKSVAKGKKLFKFRETVTSPALGKKAGEGFVKMYVDDVLYNEYDGRTGYGGQFFNKFGIYHSWITRWKDEIHGEYPTQVVYYDNLFRTNSKEKLIKLIQK